MKKIALFSLLAALVLVSCKDKCIHGDENVIMNPSRMFTSFDIVQSDLNVNHSIYIVQVKDTLEDEVAIFCEANLDPYIFTWVDPATKTLHIERDEDHCIRTKKNIEVYVYVHNLAGITSNSSGSIYCDSLTTTSLDLRVVSNGYIRMRALKVDIITADLAGTGSIDVEGDGRMGYFTNRNSNKLGASALKLKGNCSATCTGPGTISLWCDGILTADPGVAGTIYYYGSPTQIYGPYERVVPGP